MTFVFNLFQLQSAITYQHKLYEQKHWKHTDN